MRSLTFYLAVSTLVLRSSNQAYEQGKTRVVGTVKDQAEQAVLGATINLVSLDRVLQTKSLANGSFQFDDIPVGTYQLEATASGFIKQKRSLELRENTDIPLSIVLRIGRIPDPETCGAHASMTYLWRPKSVKPRLTGVPRDYSSQKPLVNATLTVSKGGESQPAFKSKSDRTGTFRFEDLAAGYYDLRISKQGYSQSEVKQVIVPREDVTSIDAVMLRQGQIIVCQ